VAKFRRANHDPRLPRQRNADFAEKILFGWTETSQKRRIDAQLALHRGMFFLSREMIDAAPRLLDAPNPETRVQSLREFVAVVRREVGAVAIDENTIKRLWRFIVDLPDPGLVNK
jgi:hypothetical protein